jgi:Putative F0F1-ATPase subunit Ca2+/Mg2+ transporter
LRKLADFAKNFTNRVDVATSVLKITLTLLTTGPRKGADMPDEPTPREMGYYAALAGTGLEMVVPAGVGWLIDGWLGTLPWITSVLAVVGFAAGLTHMILILRQKDREQSSKKKPPP